MSKMLKEDWEYVIGLEVHAQVVSKSKLFSSASATFNADPNSSVSLIDAAMPGMLPVLNEYCVHQAIKTGLALNAKINHRSVFDRKNYFYADLPQGYQISQFYHPIVEHGSVSINLEDGSEKIIRIARIHLEQDAGKSIHDQSPQYSFIDLNRSGIALMEIVTEPDLRSPFEAAEYVKKLRSILRYVGSCDGDMESGSMRVDANVSVRRIGQPLGTRCEIKNVNSIKNIVKAIEYEALRQIEMLENGIPIDQETRLFDADKGITKTMRSKEDAQDYRYFPDPDLLPVIVTDELIQKLRKEIPELPDQKMHRYVNDMGITSYNASVIVSEEVNTKFFEEAISLAKDTKIEPNTIANWFIVELFALLNKASLDLHQSKIKPSMLIEMLKLIENGDISGKIAKTVFEIMFDNGDKPTNIIKEHGLIQVSDESEIIKIVDEVLDENQSSVEEYKSGKDRLFGFFVGCVMKKTQGKANPALVNKILKDKLV
jgi:aspartyl-tRNA(Asn)/glutamyl-tRNA(Gln) amidotransferase subunit B